MKKYIVIISLFLMSTIVSGCYTVLWTPDTKLPSSDENSEGYYLEDGYYDEEYYGGYGYFYQYPWWLEVNQPAAETKERPENHTAERIRSREGSRNENTTERGENIINNAPVTRSKDPGRSDSGNRDAAEKSGNSGSSDSGSSNSTTVTRPSSDSNDASRSRNNEGARNNGGRR